MGNNAERAGTLLGLYYIKENGKKGEYKALMYMQFRDGVYCEDITPLSKAKIAGRITKYDLNVSYYHTHFAFKKKGHAFVSSVLYTLDDVFQPWTILKYINAEDEAFILGKLPEVKPNLNDACCGFTFTSADMVTLATRDAPECLKGCRCDNYTDGLWAGEKFTDELLAEYKLNPSELYTVPTILYSSSDYSNFNYLGPQYYSEAVAYNSTVGDLVSSSVLLNDLGYDVNLAEISRQNGTRIRFHKGAVIHLFGGNLHLISRIEDLPEFSGMEDMDDCIFYDELHFLQSCEIAKPYFSKPRTRRISYADYLLFQNALADSTGAA